MEDGRLIAHPEDNCTADTHSDKRLDSQMSLLVDILAELRWRRSSLRKKAEEIAVQEKWKDVANMINKGLFCMFLFVFIVLTSTCTTLWAKT